jgi:hypothetical protein
LKKENSPMLLLAEFALLFILIPLLLFLIGTRWGIYMAAWGSGLYAFMMLRRMPGFSFRKLWHGEGWSAPARRMAWVRFLFMAWVLALLTLALIPKHFMTLPIEKFSMWLLVMALYPLLSVIPQELFFRSFYFARYRRIMAQRPVAVLVNGFIFGFSHIVLNNWIAPLLCFIAGVILAQSYQQHRSLKWAVIEHSLYGCWVFTIGIGWYFFTGNFVS